MANSSLSMKNLPQQARKAVEPLAQRHVLVFFIASLALLAFTAYTINALLSQPSDSTYQSEQLQEAGISTRFDEDTIERVKQLRSREESATLTLPSGRINPFNE